MKIVVLLALLIGSMIPRNLVGSAGARSGAEHVTADQGDGGSIAHQLAPSAG